MPGGTDIRSLPRSEGIVSNDIRALIDLGLPVIGLILGDLRGFHLSGPLAGRAFDSVPICVFGFRLINFARAVTFLAVLLAIRLLREVGDFSGLDLVRPLLQLLPPARAVP